MKKAEKIKTKTKFQNIIVEAEGNLKYIDWIDRIKNLRSKFNKTYGHWKIISNIPYGYYMKNSKQG